MFRQSARRHPLVLKYGLSRMPGDLHVRFLGSGGAVRRRRYPIPRYSEKTQQSRPHPLWFSPSRGGRNFCRLTTDTPPASARTRAGKIWEDRRPALPGRARYRTRLRRGRPPRRGDDEMVEDADTAGLEGADQLRDRLVGRGHLGHGTRMLMREHRGAALRLSAFFTTSRGWTAALSIVPRKSSMNSMRRRRFEKEWGRTMSAESNDLSLGIVFAKSPGAIGPCLRPQRGTVERFPVYDRICQSASIYFGRVQGARSTHAYEH